MTDAALAELKKYITRGFFKRPVITGPGEDPWTLQQNLVKTAELSEELTTFLWAHTDWFLNLSPMELLCGCILRDPQVGGNSSVTSPDQYQFLGISPDARAALVLKLASLN